MHDDTETPRATRAAFLAAGAIGLTLASVACETEAASVADRRSIDAVLHRAARHKQVIATPKVDGGAALRYAGNSIDAFETAFGEGAGTLHVVSIFYGSSLVFAANDTLWAKYQLFDVLDRAGDALPYMVHSPQNPFDRPSGPGAEKHEGISGLMRSGMSVFVCNNALNSFAKQLGAMRGDDPVRIYNDFRSNFYPGTLVVPSGVATVLLAQEAGFGLLPA